MPQLASVAFLCIRYVQVAVVFKSRNRPVAYGWLGFSFREWADSMLMRPHKMALLNLANAEACCDHRYQRVTWNLGNAIAWVQRGWIFKLAKITKPYSVLFQSRSFRRWRYLPLKVFKLNAWVFHYFNPTDIGVFSDWIIRLTANESVKTFDAIRNRSMKFNFRHSYSDWSEVG